MQVSHFTTHEWHFYSISAYIHSVYSTIIINIHCVVLCKEETFEYTIYTAQHIHYNNNYKFPELYYSIVDSLSL